MDYKNRAKELLENGITNRREITNILKKEGYKNSQGGELNRDTVKRALQPSRNTQMLELSKDQEKTQKKLKAVKEGKEEFKPKYQDMGEYYIVTSGEREAKISKEKLKQLKELYCRDGLQINAVCRKLDIPRRDFVLVKTAFSITHDDVPYLDEELENRIIDDLVNESLEKKKEQYFLKLQQEEVNLLKREVEQYRKKEYFINKIDQSVKEHFKDYKSEPVKKLPRVENGLMLEVPIFDLHLGKMAWRPETGENFDSKIAEERFMSVINDIVERIKGRKFEKIVFPIGSDFFNYDTIDGTTTHGTRQDIDLRWQKLFNKGTELLVKAIEQLSQVAPVEALYVPGNHDWMTSYYATSYVSAWFRNNPNVTIDTRPNARKYVEFGKCLIGFTHGDKERKRIFGSMQVEAAESWGRTKYREWHGGHLHSEQTKEDMGVIVRSLSSISGTDAWHYQSGYVGAVAKTQCFVWDKERGLTEVLITTIER